MRSMRGHMRRHPVHGERGPQHQRLPVLPVHRQDQLAGAQLAPRKLRPFLSLCCCCREQHGSGKAAWQGRPAALHSSDSCGLPKFSQDGKHVVFGSVTGGMDVVKKVESYGSQSGKTSKPIVITDCG